MTIIDMTEIPSAVAGRTFEILPRQGRISLGTQQGIPDGDLLSSYATSCRSLGKNGQGHTYNMFTKHPPRPDDSCLLHATTMTSATARQPPRFDSEPLPGRADDLQNISSSTFWRPHSSISALNSPASFPSCLSVAQQPSSCFTDALDNVIQSLKSIQSASDLLPFEIFDASELEEILSDDSPSPCFSSISTEGSDCSFTAAKPDSIPLTHAEALSTDDVGRHGHSRPTSLDNGPVGQCVLNPANNQRSVACSSNQELPITRQPCTFKRSPSLSQEGSLLLPTTPTTKGQTSSLPLDQCVTTLPRLSVPSTNTRPNHSVVPALLREHQVEGYPVLSLWEFLLECLHYPCYTHILHWCSRQDGIFKISDSRRLAAMWGQYKGKKDMTFDKLSRAMRYYYTNGMLGKCRGCARLVYKFGERSGWLSFQPAADARPGRFLKPER